MTNPLATPVVIAFAGDWHSNSHWARKAIDYAATQNADVILHVGDFGYGFQPGWDEFAREVEKSLAAYDLMLLGVDGNHENFDWLEEQPIDEATGLRPITERIHHIPRGFRWTWDGVRFMGLGGAVSVGKQWRTPKVSWWWQEAIAEDDVKAAIEGAEGDRRRWAPKGDGSWGPDAGPVDVMIAHDSPLSAPLPYGSNKGPGTHWPEDVLAESEINRRRLQTAVNATNPKLLVHGHHHYRYTQLLDSGLWVEGLNCDGSIMADNIIIKSLAELKAMGR